MYPTLHNAEDYTHAYPNLHASSKQQPPPPAQPSAPAADFATLSTPSFSAPVKRANLKCVVGENRLENVECAFCSQRVASNAEQTLVFFGVCNHVAHIRCTALALAEIGAETVRAAPPEFFLGGLRLDVAPFRRLCAQCVREEVRSERIAANGVDEDTILQNFKIQYRQSAGKSYDEAKTAPLSIDEKFRILGAHKLPTGKSVLKIAQSMWSREVEDDAANAECLPQAIRRMLEVDMFVDAANRLNRTLSDFCADGVDLLTLYRCGVRTLDDLRALGFDPLIHFAKSFRGMIPFWQVHDLYAIKLEHFVSRSAGNAGMTIRQLCGPEMAGLRAPEWALLGVSVQILLGMGMRYEHLKFMKFTLDQWQRYFGMTERAHLIPLGVTTRERFVNELKWPESHEWCPN